MSTTQAADCHVYVVSRHVLPIEKPDGDCSVCGRPLADHAKQTSSLVPSDSAFVIDEKELDV